MKALKVKLLYAAALALGILYCIEVFTNGKPSTLNWIGIAIATVIMVVWLISLGIYISARSRRIEMKKAQKAAEKEAKQQLEAQSDPEQKRSSED